MELSNVISCDEEPEDMAESVLKTCPGIGNHNIHKVKTAVKNLYELSQMSSKEMTDLIGKADGKLLYDYFSRKLPN